MGEKKNNLLFNSIAPIYSLFYDFQKKQFFKVIEKAKSNMDVSSFKTILDVGCGTGALCSVLEEKGMTVTGIDPAKKMLEIARGKNKNTSIQFFQADALERLPFDDKSFDVVMASYVAHGLKAEARKRMYAEMSRMAKEYVIIHDYSAERSLLTSVVEWFEGGDYFHFIKNAEAEMKACFSDIQVISVDVRANWYVGKPILHL